MKTLNLIIWSLILPLVLWAQATPSNNIKWYHWNEGHEMAKQQNKILMLDLYTDWCGWCKKMDKETFVHPEVAQLINEYFIAIRLNPENTQNNYEYNGRLLKADHLLAVICNSREMPKYPSIIFIYPTTEKKIFIEEGFIKASAFKQLLLSHLTNLEKINGKITKD